MMLNGRHPGMQLRGLTLLQMVGGEDEEAHRGDSRSLAPDEHVLDAPSVSDMVAFRVVAGMAVAATPIPTTARSMRPRPTSTRPKQSVAVDYHRQMRRHRSLPDVPPYPPRVEAQEGRQQPAH
jgi:hypothetical protein